MSQDAARFFRRHAGYSYDPRRETQAEGRKRSAQRLAIAEAKASASGYYYDWRIDEQIDSSDFSDERPAWSLWECGMFNADGEIVQSLCGIDFGRDGSPFGDSYKRVVEAELALQECGS